MLATETTIAGRATLEILNSLSINSAVLIKTNKLKKKKVSKRAFKRKNIQKI